MHHLWLTASVLATSAFVMACGGGGGGSTPAPTPLASAEGFYQGTVSTGTQFQLLALENDQFYSLVGNTDAQGVFRVVSLVEGKGLSSSASFSASNVKEYQASGQVFTGTLSASYNPKTSISGSVSSASGVTTFSGTAPTTGTSNYLYDSPASLSLIAGSWTGTTLYNESLNFSISSSGGLSGVSALGCSFSGTVSPRVSGKNVLDVSVTFGPAPCALAGQKATGIAVSYLLTSGKRQLLVAATDIARSAGTVVFAQR